MTVNPFSAFSKTRSARAPKRFASALASGEACGAAKSLKTTMYRFDCSSLRALPATGTSMSAASTTSAGQRLRRFLNG